MRLALQAINDLEREGLIQKAAIGGAMGATFYLEPVSTFDLDIFVIFEGQPLILTLTPIYDFLKARGHLPEGDAVVVGNWPVQLLPAETPLCNLYVGMARRMGVNLDRFGDSTGELPGLADLNFKGITKTA